MMREVWLDRGKDIWNVYTGGIQTEVYIFCEQSMPNVLFMDLR